MPLGLKRRGKYWWIYGSHQGIKVRETTGQTAKRKAELVLGRRQRELADPTHYRAHQATVRTAAARWFREIRATRKAPTVHFYKCKAAHVVRLLGDVRLSKLTHEVCLGFLEQRRADGAHPHTYSRELVALRLILKSAKRAGEFVGDPRDTVPRIASGYVPQEEWVEPHVIWAAITELPEERGAALAFVAATACDFGNLEHARPEDVLEDRVRVRGTKTEKRARWLPRVAVFDTFLRHAVAYARKGQPTLFEPWPYMAREVRAACRKAGVQEFTARTIRRSCATWMARARVPFPVAMKFMGHASMTMLLKVYAKYDVDIIGEQIAEKMT
jgi:integrase